MTDFMNVDSNINEVIAGLNDVAVKQVPFAIALGLTRTAQAAQEYIIQQIPSIFNITNKWYLKNKPTGIKITMTKKGDITSKGEGTISVYTNAFFLNWQSKGGKKYPGEGKALLIPVWGAPKYARRSTGHKKIFEGKKTLRQRGHVVIDMHGATGVFQRVGKERYPIRKIYSVQPYASIKSRFDMDSMVQKIVDEKYKAIFKEALDYAMKTAK